MIEHGFRVSYLEKISSRQQEEALRIPQGVTEGKIITILHKERPVGVVSFKEDLLLSIGVQPDLKTQRAFHRFAGHSLGEELLRHFIARQPEEQTVFPVSQIWQKGPRLVERLEKKGLIKREQTKLGFERFRLVSSRQTIAPKLPLPGI